MSDSRFVYVTYIRTTPEKLWQALLDSEFTRRYWCATWQDCAWKPGFTFTSTEAVDVLPGSRGGLISARVISTRLGSS